VFKLLLFYLLVFVSHVSCASALNFLFLLTFIMYLECHCFNCVSMFYSLICLIIDVLINVDSGLWMFVLFVCLFVVIKPENPYFASRPGLMYIHMIIELFRYFSETC